MGSRELYFNAFYMASPAQSWAGLWAHPRADGDQYNKVRFWVDLARRAESGLLDGIFLADTLGVNDVFEGTPDASMRSGAMFPTNDPNLVISAMAAVTENLCFGITGNTTYDQPYLLARRFSTLDHLTEGRVAWNVVTGILPSIAKAMGRVEAVSHDQRYDIADEFMDLVYKLWEESWTDGAAVRDKAARVFADPSRIRPIHHQSEHFACDGIHLVEPSPQRTPLIFSAGASGRGREFASKHAECVFMSTNNMEFARKTSAAYREAAIEAGREHDSIKVFNAATVVVAATESEARDLAAEYQSYSDEAGNLAIFSSWLGTDLSHYSPEEPLENIGGNAIQSIAASMRASSGGKPVTVRDLGKFAPVGGREALIVGSATQVADELLAWRDRADIDGFNLLRTVEPGGLQGFIDHAVPELQRRGAFKTRYGPGTMREKLFPRGTAKLPVNHYGSRFRRTDN
jgi:FMN-dependent oxidoreductase (nitrilotriacetate monooxygenase family)